MAEEREVQPAQMNEVNEFKAKRAPLFRSALRKTMEKCQAACKLSQFARCYNRINSKDKASIQNIHSHILNHFKQSVDEEIELMIGEENLDEMMIALDKLEDSMSTDQLSWRPSGNPNIDVIPHVMPILSDHKAQLAKLLSDLEEENRQLQKQVLIERKQLIDKQVKVKSSLEKFSQASDISDKLPYIELFEDMKSLSGVKLIAESKTKTSEERWQISSAVCLERHQDDIEMTDKPSQSDDDVSLSGNLVLIVKQDLDSDGQPSWMFPQTVKQVSESVEDAAERLLSNFYGPNLKAELLSETPCGFYQRQSSKDCAGDKVFIYRAKHLGGDLELSKTDISDHKWIAKDKLSELLSPDYLGSIMDMITDCT